MNPNQALWEKGDFTRLAVNTGSLFPNSAGVNFPTL